MNLKWIIVIIGALAALATLAIRCHLGTEHLMHSSPDELAQKWTEERATRIAQETSAWVTNAHPETAGIDRNWLSAEINSSAQWEITPARPVREKVYEATATASVRIDLPHRPGMTADARVPWNLRIYPDNQGIEANRLRKKYGNTPITQPVAATPLWEQASLRLAGETPADATPR